jgi:hypothetical protein
MLASEQGGARMRQLRVALPECVSPRLDLALRVEAKPGRLGCRHAAPVSGERTPATNRPCGVLLKPCAIATLGGRLKGISFTPPVGDGGKHFEDFVVVDWERQEKPRGRTQLDRNLELLLSARA